MGFKKQGAKKQGHCYSKREEARLLLLFLNNNDPIKFQNCIKISGLPDKLE